MNNKANNKQQNNSRANNKVNNKRGIHYESNSNEGKFKG